MGWPCVPAAAETLHSVEQFTLSPSEPNDWLDNTICGTSGMMLTTTMHVADGVVGNH